MTVTPVRVRRSRSDFDDTPQTSEDFARLADLPPGPDREELKGELVTAWLPMAHRLAGRYRNSGENLEDLRQVAALGLVKAVDRYDPERGHVFESFAVPTVVGEIKRYFRDATWDTHVPRRVQQARNAVRVALRELDDERGERGERGDRRPTVTELVRHTGLGEEDVRLGLEALNSYRALSLDAQLADGDEDEGNSLLGLLGHADAGFDHVVNRETVKPYLAALPERERRILYLRFFRGMTQSAIGRELGVSQMHVSRLINGVCLRLREAIADDRREPVAA